MQSRDREAKNLALAKVLPNWPPVAPRCRCSGVLGIIRKSLRSNGLCFAVGAIDNGDEPKFHCQLCRNPGIRENRVLHIWLPALHCCPQRPPGTQRRQRLEGARRGRREADSSRSRKGIRLCLGCRSDDALSCTGAMDSHPKLGKSMAHGPRLLSAIASIAQLGRQPYTISPISTVTRRRATPSWLSPR